MIGLVFLAVVVVGAQVAKSVEKRRAKKRVIRRINDNKRIKAEDEERRQTADKQKGQVSSDDDDESSLNVETHEIHINDRSNLRRKFRRASRFRRRRDN